MVEDEEKHSKGTDWLSAISFGFFLVLFGTIWMITPNLLEETRKFFMNFQLEKVTGNMVFPASKDSHPVVYKAAMQFCFIFGTFQIVVLALRFVRHDSLGRKGETISSMVFWLSAGLFLSLLAKETIGWFSFLAGLVISVGLSIIASNIVKLFKTG